MGIEDLYHKLNDLISFNNPENSLFYHKIIHSLPKLFSLNDLIDYHNFLINGNHITIDCDPGELDKSYDKRERILTKYKKCRNELHKQEEIFQKFIDTERKNFEKKKKHMLEQLKNNCSPEAYSQIESIIETI